MGTNYYARLNYCEHCQRFDEIALGKSSGGWCFTLHVYPEKRINTLDDLMKYIGNAPIYNEYDVRVSKKHFLDVVTERSWPKRDYSKIDPFDSLSDFLTRNGAEKGPNNLLRHKIGNFCIGHGEGTYDYCVGEFS